MDRAEIVACRSNGEEIFSGLSSNSQMEKTCLDFRGSLHHLLQYGAVAFITRLSNAPGGIFRWLGDALAGAESLT